MSAPVVVLGLAGKAGVGKDAAAEYLASAYACQRFAFAAPIKEAVLRWVPSWGPEQMNGERKEWADPEREGISPRMAFQIIGEAGRRIHPDFWIWQAKAAQCKWSTQQLLESRRWVLPLVWTDVRYANEAEWIRGQGGQVIHLRRAAAAPVRAHESEAGVAVVDGDEVIVNDGTLEELHAKLDGVMLERLIRATKPAAGRCRGALR